MISDYQNYSLFYKFIETYGPEGFNDIDRSDPLITELEDMCEKNDQFFYGGDLVQMKIQFTSKRSWEMMGIEPENVSPYHFFEATHPDDMERQTLGRANIFKMAHDLFSSENGTALMSTNFKIRNPRGEFTEMLFQMYLYFSTAPYKSVYILKVHTNIDWFRKRKYGYHYYRGNDLSYFRYPDEKLLQVGNPFSDHEFRIIRMIESGKTSEEIAEELFLSVHTVNTHRRNILEKSGKTSMAELIYELLELGVL